LNFESGDSNSNNYITLVIIEKLKNQEINLRYEIICLEKMKDDALDVIKEYEIIPCLKDEIEHYKYVSSNCMRTAVGLSNELIRLKNLVKTFNRSLKK
jgi:hypothetical protein